MSLPDKISQQYALAPANYVTPIPDGVPSDLAAPLLCGGVTVYAGLKKSGAQPVRKIVSRVSRADRNRAIQLSFQERVVDWDISPFRSEAKEWVSE